MERLSGTALVVLGLLALRPRSGYEIKQTIDKTTRFFWNGSYGRSNPGRRSSAGAPIQTSSLATGSASTPGRSAGARRRNAGLPKRRRRRERRRGLAGGSGARQGGVGGRLDHDSHREWAGA